MFFLGGEGDGAGVDEISMWVVRVIWLSIWHGVADFFFFGWVLMLMVMLTLMLVLVLWLVRWIYPMPVLSGFGR